LDTKEVFITRNETVHDGLSIAHVDIQSPSRGGDVQVQVATGEGQDDIDNTPDSWVLLRYRGRIPIPQHSNGSGFVEERHDTVGRGKVLGHQRQDFVERRQGISLACMFVLGIVLAARHTAYRGG
jgi:hypothetical protein